MWKLYKDTVHNEKYLYKFLSEANLQKFLSSGEIWFSLAREFGDRMECTTIDDFSNGKLDIKTIQQRQNKYLISCWHSATKEVLSMWDTYVDAPENRRKVALRFLKTNLIQLVKQSKYLPANSKSSIHGRVLYKNIIGKNKTSLQEKRLKHFPFRKEYAFRYEKEYRFVIQLNKSFQQKGWGCQIGDANDLSFEILVNPLLKKDDYIKTKQKLLKGTHKGKVTESSLAKWLLPESDLWD
jgi:hypothetical protein